jgi:hypothetical protein
MDENNRGTPDLFDVNKEIAYLGEIGCKREQFCLDFYKRKQASFTDIARTQLYETSRARETIACRPGCVYCCAMIIAATLQECELIVYYLYTHDRAMVDFLARYSDWREGIRRGGELYQHCLGRGDEDTQLKISDRFKPKKTAALEAYYAQNLPCPFLGHGMCSIYEVRPCACASHIAVSSPDYCRVGSPIKALTRHAIPKEFMQDASFYFNKLESQVMTFMPVTVYELLRYGTHYYIATPGLERLDREFKRDPAVVAALSRYEDVDNH